MLDDVARLTVSIAKVRPFIVTEDWRPTLLTDRADLQGLVTRQGEADGVVRRLTVRSGEPFAGPLVGSETGRRRMPAKDIFERLKQDHDKHRRLIAAIEKTVGDSEERRSLFEEFKTDATAHAATEELTLYHELMGESSMRAYAQHAAKDHHEIEEALQEVAKADFKSSGWLKKFAGLKDTYLDHIKEEEETIFPDALKDLGEKKAVELRDAFNAQKPEEIERAEADCDEKINERIG